MTKLLELRASSESLTAQHPEVSFLPLPQVLQRWREQELDESPLRYGLALLRPRYAELGLERLLPLERVTVGVRSDRPGAWGGFHHPNQGYRHLQMRAIVTVFGDLGAGLPADPALAALDLLRSYAHDCLHYGSYRSYRLADGEIVRTQYGLNFRRDDGGTYSAPDAGESPSTRNLGVIMEGACDREARAITRAAARKLCITRDGGDMAHYGLRDVTGALGGQEMAVLADPAARAAVAPGSPAGEFLRCMGTFQRGVNDRYATFLREVGGEEAEELHTAVLQAMLSGSLTGLSGWLNQRHGARAFSSLFRSPTYVPTQHRTLTTEEERTIAAST